MNTIDEAYRQAKEVLYRCMTDIGFKASALENGYPQIWARDSVITSLGACLIKGSGSDFLSVLRASLDTLTSYQSQMGLIPLNVDVATRAVSTENAGAVDSNLWYILGNFYYYIQTNDLVYLKARWPAIKRALLWVRYQDMNECGLLEIPEAGNWMDLLAVRYNTLYDNILYYGALKAFSRMAPLCGESGEEALRLADQVYELVNMLFWVDRKRNAQEIFEHFKQLKMLREEWYKLYYSINAIFERPYYLPYLAFRQFGDYCDTLGNLLAILLGIANPQRSEIILTYVEQVGIHKPFPSRALHPPIFPGHPDWRDYYLSRNLNLPFQYHNGGIWPFIGGFHVAALVKTGHQREAERLLHRLALANKQGSKKKWEFNEWLHGQTGKPMGCAYQAWSAGMYLYAYEAVNTGRLPLFEELM